jgi:hypothetical protein
MTVNHPEASAPLNVVLLVHGAGGWRLGIKDDLGNWRGQHGGTVKHPPTVWRHLPPSPDETPEEHAAWKEKMVVKK